MDKHLKTASFLAKLLDNQFRIWKFRFGIDPILGLIPGGGDTVSLLLSLYIIWVGLKLNLPQKHVLRMIGNVFLDFFLGLIPFIGDIFDFAFKANIKNLEIIRKNFPTID